MLIFVMVRCFGSTTWPKRTRARCRASARQCALASGDNRQSAKARGQIEFGQVWISWVSAEGRILAPERGCGAAQPQRAQEDRIS